MADSTSRIQLGILGFGRIGQIHAASVASSRHATLAAVCDSDESALDFARRTYDVTTHSSVDRFLDLPFDGVIVASSSQHHANHVQACASAGKATFVEKPIALSMADCDRALTAVERAKVVFQIGYQRRWDERYRRIKSAIAAGTIGRPVFLKTVGRDPDSSAPGKLGLDRNGGLFVNCAIHDYDLARHLFGQEVAHVRATAAALVHTDLASIGDVDTALTTLVMADGSIASTEWNRYSHGFFEAEVEVVGTTGSVRLAETRDTDFSIQQRGSGRPTVAGYFDKAYRASIDAFINSVATGTSAAPSIGDARSSLQVALLARESFRNNGATMKVPPLEPLTP